ncbi:BgTH12-04644 [Blumeria graminis f. sp. triticale]|uniref:BgTH12-04644 n=1 Tax=Blumeria graminis f. sp. triticale TaxID=1689686 RepID=A0A9W4D0D4_BLUGR|nr:BgTH12-04644 [Blumeria graminis f. sp. triticale]
MQSIASRNTQATLEGGS